MQSKKNSSNHGFRLRSILIHSLWITILGLLLFRLATANTQTVLQVKIFAISGAAIASAPWIVQLLVSTVIILAYNAGVCDLTWLVLPKECSGCRVSKARENDIEGGGVLNGRIGNGHGLYSVNGGNNGCEGFGMHVRIEGRNGPQLQRNRTV